MACSRLHALVRRAAQALDDAGWAPSTPAQRAATGVCIGAGIGSTADTAEAGALIAAGKLRRVSPFFVPRILVNMAAGAVSIKHGLMGPNHAPSTACATGVHAIGDAYRMVQRGDADVMVRAAWASAWPGSLGRLSAAGGPGWTTCMCWCMVPAVCMGYSAAP